MTLLIIIGLCLLFWYYVLPWLLRRQIRKTFGFDPRNPQRQEQPRPRQPEPPVAKKKIDPTVGEYVEFTETVETTTRHTAEGEETSVRVEQQITDVQWEDIPADSDNQ